MAYNSRSSRRSGGYRKPGRRTPWSSQNRRSTRRSGARTKRGNGMGVAFGVGAGLLAVNAALLGAAGTSRAIRELGSSGKTVIGFLKQRGVRKAALKATTASFSNARKTAISMRKVKTTRKLVSRRVKRWRGRKR